MTVKPIEGKVGRWQGSLFIGAFLILAATWGIWKYQYFNREKVPVNYLQITANSPPAGRSLLPEQRRKFAVEFEKNYRDKGMNVTVTTRGDFHTTLVIEGTIVNRRSVLMMKDTPEAISEFRDMGFKHLMMTNGTAAWDVDLKN